MRGFGDFDPPENELTAEDVWADNHTRCERSACGKDVCTADAEGGVGRENCVCHQEAPAAVHDGIDPDLVYCSTDCLVLELAGMARSMGCGAFFAGSSVTDGAEVAS